MSDAMGCSLVAETPGPQRDAHRPPGWTSSFLQERTLVQPSPTPDAYLPRIIRYRRREPLHLPLPPSRPCPWEVRPLLQATGAQFPALPGGAPPGPPAAPRTRASPARLRPGGAGSAGAVRVRRRVGARGRRSAGKMAAAVTFLRLLGRGGAVTRGLPGGARCFGVRTSPTGEKVTHTGQV